MSRSQHEASVLLTFLGTGYAACKLFRIDVVSLLALRSTRTRYKVPGGEMDDRGGH